MSLRDDDQEFFDGLIWFFWFLAKLAAAGVIVAGLLFMLIIEALYLYDLIIHS
jgi:hypothetical protein